MDYFAGVPAKELAQKRGVNLARVYQIIHATLAKFNANIDMSKEEVGLLYQRWASLQELPWYEEPSTPEQFYWRTLKDNRKE